MHFSRALVFSAVVYASAAFAATIHVDDTEINIKEYHKQLADSEVSEQLVFPMLNSPPEY